MKRACSYCMDTLLEPDTLLTWWHLIAVVTIYKVGKVVLTKGYAASE